MADRPTGGQPPVTRLGAGLRRRLRRALGSSGPEPDRLHSAETTEPEAASSPTPVPGTSSLTVDGDVVLAHPDPYFRASWALAEHAALVADAFEAHDVGYVVLLAEVQRPRVLMVAEEERASALQALATELGGSATYRGEQQSGRVRRPSLVEDPADGVGDALRIFRYRVSTAGRLLGGPELGCDVQFWRRAGDDSAPVSREQVPGSLIGPRSAARVPDLIPPDQQRTELRPVDGRPRPRFAGLGEPHLLGAAPPIDAVYTWVDGSDPAWLAAKADALAELDPTALHVTAAHDSRFSSRDELRYSLRSLDMYADWIRHVFLVTADQVPAWLVQDHPDLTVVSHAELFADRGRLPTFNSHAIETQLHHIGGLSENYLYLNDDVFFGRPVEPSAFVLPNGIARFFLSTVKIAPGPVSPIDRPFTAAAKNGRDLLQRRFGRTVTSKFQHAPHSLQRSVMDDVEADFAAEVAQTAAAQFRGPGDISMSAALGHYYGYATGRSVPGRLAYAYVDIGLPDAADRLAPLLGGRGVDAFCLNDNEPSDVEPDIQEATVRSFLEALFPVPSRFER